MLPPNVAHFKTLLLSFTLLLKPLAPSMASPPPHLVPFLLLAMARLSAPQDVSDGAAMMDGQELLGLFEVMGTLLEDTNWAQLHPHPCTDTPWPGIQCEVGQEQDPTFHVTELHVGPDVVNPPCKTSAILSQSLLKLPYLKTLSILSCFLTTPASLSSSLFGPISSLEQIVFKSNPSLSGEIPTTLSQIPSLRVLSLSQNNLHGGIPKELGGLAGLEELDLGYNYLTGEIPQEIGGLASLAILDLCCNDLQGNVPPTIGNLLSLQKMDLSYNNLVGSVPPDMGHLHRLVLLDLSHNFLSGPIPETLSGLKELEYFLLADNPINTRIPLFLVTVEKLTVVSLSGCGLTGQIPTSFSSLAHLTALSLDRNGLSGPVPQNLGALPHLGQLNLSQNRLSGELSFPQDFVHRLGERLDVRGNKGLCVRNHMYENMSMYLDLDSPACLDSDQSSSGPWEQGTGADDKRLKPAWFDGKGSSEAADVYGGLVLQWSMGCNLIVILMGCL